VRVRRELRAHPGGAGAHNGPAGLRQPERVALLRPARAPPAPAPLRPSQRRHPRLREHRVQRQARRPHQDAPVESGPAGEAGRQLPQDDRSGQCQARQCRHDQ